MFTFQGSGDYGKCEQQINSLIASTTIHHPVVSGNYIVSDRMCVLIMSVVSVYRILCVCVCVLCLCIVYCVRCLCVCVCVHVCVYKCTV